MNDKIKIIISYNHEKLQTEINDFIVNKTIKNIQINTTKGEGRGEYYYTCSIQYKEVE